MSTTREGKIAKPPLRHLPRPGRKSTGEKPPRPDALGRHLSMCGNRFAAHRFVDQKTALQIKEGARREQRGKAAERQIPGPDRLCNICMCALRKMLRPVVNPPMPKRPWTDAERETVRLEYRHNRGSVAHLARKLDRTENSIKGVIQQLGITRSHGRKRWTRKDDQRLIDLAGAVSMPRIAQILGRSTNSVVVRSKRLRISLRDRTGWYTARDVARLLGVDDHWVRTRLQSGVPPGTRYTAQGDAAKLDVHDEALSGLTWRIEEYKPSLAFCKFGFVGRR